MSNRLARADESTLYNLRKSGVAEDSVRALEALALRNGTSVLDELQAAVACYAAQAYSPVNSGHPERP